MVNGQYSCEVVCVKCGWMYIVGDGMKVADVPVECPMCGDQLRVRVTWNDM